MRILLIGLLTIAAMPALGQSASKAVPIRGGKTWADSWVIHYTRKKT
ncbi:MAG TPA: hypothetical protein VGI90_07890 [Steroidobacteraceae bacterium]|jgi:hypothetical protein